VVDPTSVEGVAQPWRCGSSCPGGRSAGAEPAAGPLSVTRWHLLSTPARRRWRRPSTGPRWRPRRPTRRAGPRAEHGRARGRLRL